MTEEALDDETRRRKEAEAWLGLAIEALERASKQDKWKEVKEAMRKLEEGERSGLLHYCGRTMD